jgi:hypothetical protein
MIGEYDATCSTLKCFELLGECRSDGRISKAPSHDAAIGVVPPVPALRPNAVARVKFVHGVKALTETTGRHDDVDEVRVVALDGPRASAAFVADHFAPVPLEFTVRL